MERDRLDILGLDSDGHPVVVELKRDKAPDTVDMQALKYAALVSRFTLSHLAAAHADYVRKRDPDHPVSDEQALALLTEQSTVDEQTLRAPRIILMAASFPRTVTATVVYLNQSLNLDIRLLAFKAYRTGGQVLVTISQLYPPLEVADFVLDPEVQRRRDRNSAETTRDRDMTSVARIIAGNLLEVDSTLTFVAPAGPGQTHPGQGHRMGRRGPHPRDRDLERRRRRTPHLVRRRPAVQPHPTRADHPPRGRRPRRTRPRTQLLADRGRDHPVRPRATRQRDPEPGGPRRSTHR